MPRTKTFFRFWLATVCYINTSGASYAYFVVVTVNYFVHSHHSFLLPSKLKMHRAVCTSSNIISYLFPFKSVCFLIFRVVDIRAAAIHRCTGESRYFLSRYEYRYLNGISLYRKTGQYKTWTADCGLRTMDWV